MRYTLEVNIDDDVLRASGMTPELYLRRTMGSLQEYGIRVIATREPDSSQRSDQSEDVRSPRSPRPRWLSK